MNKIGSCLLLLLLIGLSACKTKGLARRSELKKKSVAFLLTQLNKTQVDFDWMEVKAKAKVESPERNIGFIVKMRVRQDSLIWMTINKLSLEFVRVQISPSRLEVLNRDENSYRADPFTSIRNQMPIPLTFKDFQNLLVGNPIIMDDVKFSYRQDSLHYILSGPLTSKDRNTPIGMITLKIRSRWSNYCI